MTVTIQIGNTDNKLTQQEWAAFVMHVGEEITAAARQKHFFGGSATHERWQNVCWVVEMSELVMPSFKAEIEHIRKRFRQDSVAMTVGETEMV